MLWVTFPKLILRISQFSTFLDLIVLVHLIIKLIERLLNSFYGEQIVFYYFMK